MSSVSLTGIADLITRYPVLVVDQWGVMHDGKSAFANAQNCLARAVAAGAWVVSVSNSSRRCSESISNLQRLGYVAGQHFHAVMTSGESLAEDIPYFIANFGHAVYHISWTSAGLQPDTATNQVWHEVANIPQANWILCSGHPRTQQVEPLHQQLQQAQRLKLPLVCANPDRVTVTPDGDLVDCPGKLADYYQSIGGKVFWYGKPADRIYQSALTKLAKLFPAARPAINPGNILGIGDSLQHDIAGIHAYGGKGLLITAGIHQQELASNNSGQLAKAAARLAATMAVAAPEYVMPKLQW